MEQQICGTCKYRSEDDYGIYFCDNELGHFFNCLADYEDECKDWEEQA